MSRVRAQLIGLLRKQGHFERGAQAGQCLNQGLPARLGTIDGEGRILEGWAEKEPARFDEAVSHWVTLRLRLQAVRPRPPEYYEVMYHVAACLVREAEKSKDQAAAFDRARKAEQVLKAALVLSPKLNGPDTVARYRVLLDQGDRPARTDAWTEGGEETMNRALHDAPKSFAVLCATANGPGSSRQARL